MKYSVYGMHRSGTNWLSKLVKSSVGGDYLPTNERARHKDWKHTFTKDNFTSDITYLYIYKNPYQWIESVGRNCEDIHGILGNLPRGNKHSIPTYNRGKSRGNTDILSLCTLYNKTLGLWLEKSKRYDIRFIYYNTLLEDIDHLTQFIDTTSPIEDVNMEYHVNIKMQRNIDDSIRDYYKEGLPENLSKETTAYISENINDELFDKLNITKL